MASWTNPTIHATADVLSVTDYDSVANNTTFLYQAPYIAAYNSVSVTVNSSSLTQITLGGLTASGYGFTVSSNNIVLPLTGVYYVSYSAQFSFGAGSGATYVQGVVQHNGSDVLFGGTGPTGVSIINYPSAGGSGIVLGSSGDTLGLWAQQNSGSPLDTATGAPATYLHVFLIGSQ